MKYTFMLIIFSCFLWGSSFITQEDYSRSLYFNPRGIGCNNCHGNKGEGSTIGSFVYKGKNKTLVAPSIRNLEKNKFIKALSTKHKIMPTYFLTPNEIEMIYLYLIDNNVLDNKGKK